jgi:ferric-dicitrate binding protein FerR (iron transport regulator)
MSDEVNWTLLDRYFAGECSPSEREDVERSASADSARRAMLASAQVIWEKSSTVSDGFDVDSAWRSVHARLGAPRETASPAIASRRPQFRSWSAPRSWRAYAGIAAVAVIAVGTAWFSWLDGSSSFGTGASAPMREYTTLRGQRAEALLSDGSRVWLNVDSKLQVPAGYGSRSREVHLSGEALFEVAHDERRPFVVRAGVAVAEDLGTEFVIRAYSSDSVATVVVVSGRVALRAESPGGKGGVAMEANQLGRVEQSGVVTITPDIDIGPYVAWRTGRLEFRRTPLVRVLEDLERTYDVTILLADTTLATVPVTAVLDRQPLDAALRILSQSLDVRVVRRGQQIELHPRHREQQ